MGYFRLFYYIAYIFNTICRIIKRHGKQILWVVCIFGFLIFCMWPSKSHAVYNGDYSYSDANFAIQQYYDSVCLDFLRRVEYGGSDLKDFFKTRFTGRDYYIFYGSQNVKDGSTVINGGTYNAKFLYIYFYNPSITDISVSFSAYDDYNGIFTDIYKVTYNDSYSSRSYYLSPDGVYNSYSVDNTTYFYIPSNLLHYQNTYLYDYFFNDISYEEILAQIEETNDKLGVVIDSNISSETENTVQEAIEDIPETFDNSYTQDIKDNEDTLLDTILTPIYTYADGTTTRRINFTLPFVDYTYQLRSDAISSHIRNTNIYTYIQLFWWFAFSIPIFILLRRIVVWLGTGEFLNKPSRFAVYMSDFISKNITPGMM